MRTNFLVVGKIVSASLLVCILFLSGLPQAQAQLASQMYSWGSATQIGRPTGDGLGNNPPAANRPGRVGTEYWISSATSSGGSLAVRADGRLFALIGAGQQRIYTGDNTCTQVWTQISARHDHRVALNADGQIFSFTNNADVSLITPVQIPGSQSHTWIYVMSGNSQAFAINSYNQLFSNGTGAIAGRGPTPSPTLSRITVPPNNPACTLEWVSVRAGASTVLAVTECGRLFSWGTGVPALGRSTNTLLYNGIGQRNVPQSYPGRVGMGVGCAGFNTNWVAVGATNTGAAALNADGHIYTWGGAAELGRPSYPDDPSYPPVNTPGRVTLQSFGTPANPARFRSLHGSNGAFLAFTDEYRLYSWGGGGALGRATAPVPANRPGLVARVYGFSDAARGGGGTAIMLMRTTPAEGDLYIAKNLRKLQAAPVPSLEFEFEFERHSFNGNIAQANLLPNIPNLTVEIDNTSESSTVGGVTTLSSRENALAGITFTQIGVYSWMVSEVEDSSDTNTNPPGTRRVNYSQARYEVRVDVGLQMANFYIHDVSLYRHNRADGTAVIPPEPVDGFDGIVFFTNDYRRFSLGTNTCAGALTVSKEIDGDFVDPATPFTFEVTLTGTALCAAGTEFSARVYGPNNNFIRTETFEVGETETVILLDEQTLVFPYLPVGLQWEVEELALVEFTAALDLTANGVTNPRVTNPNPNLSLSTQVHTITAENLRNSAHFINIHFITPPMGLMIGNGTAYVMVAAAGLMLVSLLVLKRYRRREYAEFKSLVRPQGVNTLKH